MSSDMLDYVLTPTHGLLGYDGAGWWVTLLGAVALTFDCGFSSMRCLGRDSRFA